MSILIWIEMAKDKEHGGQGWEFKQCLWSPEYKLVNGKNMKWAYWESVKQVKAGDIVVHLRGNKKASFIGQSIAETDGFRTVNRPSTISENWEYSKSFYRVNLADYKSFKYPLELDIVFKKKEQLLREYYNFNKNRKAQEKRLLFYAIQNAALRRQNGAYLSEVDDKLYKILFEEGVIKNDSTIREVETYAVVDEGIANLAVRKGQNDFSENVRKNFLNTCCFPGCEVCDRSFLVGAHIARWADYPKLRGQTANGLCLCLVHDKAFELGLFTLNEKLQISVNKERLGKFHQPIAGLNKSEGKVIKKSEIQINKEYLKYHWTRIGYKPE